MLIKKVLCLALFVVLTPDLTLAAEWRFTPSIDLTETYTDNVTLDSGSDKESEWISQINPAFSLSGNGKELALTFGYRMQNLLYLGDSDRNNTNHQLNTALTATLAPHWLFLDASSTLNQQVLSPDEKVSIGNISAISGREDVLTTTVSPYIKTRLTSWVLSELRFSHDSVEYSGNTAADSSSDQVNVSLQSAKAFGSWTWAVRYTEQETKYSTHISAQLREDEKRRDTVLDLGYQLSAKIRLTGQAGYEDNEYQLSADSETPEGEYWNVGAVWTPTSQTMLTASGGERYFGRTWKLDWSHKARRQSWRLAYDENLSSQRQLQLEQRDFLLFDQNGLPVIDPGTLQQAVFNINVLVPTDEIFIDQRTTFEWSMQHRKSTTTVRANRSHREFQESNLTEITSGVDLSWELDVSRNGNFTANVGVQKIERDTGNDQYRLISTTYEEQLGRHVSSLYELRNVRRNTRGANNDYRENQLSASLRMSW